MGNFRPSIMSRLAKRSMLSVIRMNSSISAAQDTKYPKMAKVGGDQCNLVGVNLSQGEVGRNPVNCFPPRAQLSIIQDALLLLYKR